MRTLILLAISTAVASPAAAFGQQRSNQDTAAGMRQAAGQDSFVQKAAASDSAEIALGNLAKDHSRNKDVQDFAKEMVKDHSKSSKDLREAVGSSVTFPAELDQAHLAIVQRLSSLNGDEFDREYIQTMVTEHQKAVELLQSKADENGQKMASRGNETGGPNVSNDAAVTEWASKTLPVIKDHLQKAQELQQKTSGNNNAPGATDANGSRGYNPPSSPSDSSAGSRGRTDSSGTGSMSPR